MTQTTLRVTAVLYAAGYVLHSADHFARGLSLTPPAVFWLGTLAAPGVALVVALGLLGHRYAPIVAVLAGASMALTASLIHLPPYWGALSEPFRSNVGVWDWLSLAAMVGGGLAYMVAGALALRTSAATRRRSAPA